LLGGYVRIGMRPTNCFKHQVIATDEREKTELKTQQIELPATT
jgi:hypothetical protein